ncbi:hypothetical protein [Streptomyces bungoensis]|uniref:hypothetical protein n=1 Tax=Streptomyces bungoensis TaxID=285568 RepID=UPI0033F5C42A
MRVRSTVIGGSVLVCLLMPVVTACGDTNNITQHAGRDGKVCVDNAACQEGAAESPASETPDASSPSDTEPATEPGSGSSAGGGTEDQASSAAPGPARSGGTPGAAVSDVRLRYLTDVGPIGGYGNNEGKGPSRLGDSVLPQSIEFAPGVFATEVKSLSFNVPSGLTRFQATVGLDQNTLPDYEAHVGIRRRDGTTLADLTLKSGETYPVSEDLGGTNLITIDVEIVHWAKDAINSRPHVVVGNGRFVK